MLGVVCWLMLLVSCVLHVACELSVAILSAKCCHLLVVRCVPCVIRCLVLVFVLHSSFAIVIRCHSWKFIVLGVFVVFFCGFVFVV